jgi:MFS family permease
MIFVIAFALGCVATLEGPARQVLAIEMVGPELVGNAVSLNEVVINGSRVFGPAIGGILIAQFGTAVCFLVNAGSFIPAVIALALIRPAELFAEPLVERSRGQLRAGLHYSRTTPIVRSLLFMAAAGAVVFNFGVAWPLMAERVLHAGAAGYGAMVTAFGIGALVGAFFAASDLAPHGRRVRTLALASGVAVIVSALVPNLATELAVEVVTGFLSIWFIAVANATIQMRTAPAMRGRVMGLWSMALPGSIPLTSLIVGGVAEAFGGRAAFSLGGIGLLVALVFGWHALGEDEHRIGWRRSTAAAPADLGV